MPIYSSRPKGPVTGDLSGSYPEPQVVNLSGSATGSFLGTFNGEFGVLGDITSSYDSNGFKTGVGIPGANVYSKFHVWENTRKLSSSLERHTQGDYAFVISQDARDLAIGASTGGAANKAPLGVYIQAFNAPLFLDAIGNDVYVNATSGNMGVGMSSGAGAKLDVSGNVRATSFTGSLLGTASYATTALTASYVNPLTQSVYIQGGLSASGGITGSFSGSAAYLNEVQISDYLRLLPVGAINIPTNQSASYIYTSGSTNDMYFTQYNPPYTNTTRLRWLEGALNTGLLHGGVISTANGTNTFSITSGSGLIVSFNAFTGSDPYPTINFVNFTGSSNIPLQYSSSAQITYVSMDKNGHVVQKTTPPTFSDFKTSIVLGRVLHQSGSVTNGAINTPPTAYGVNSNVADFVRAIGPLKISGHYLEASASATNLSLKKSTGDSYVEGRNYSLDPNIPNIVLAENDLPVTVSKIFRQYMSGSTPIINTNNNNGYPTLDAEHYQLPDGTTGSVGTDFTVQRIFWFPRAVNSALFAYYGQAKYNNLDDAIAGISTENFVEGDNTKTSAILVGYVVLKGNANDFSNTNTSRIYQAGLFRGSTGGGGGGAAGGATNLSSLTDVQIGSPFTEGQALVWSVSSGKWIDGDPANAGYATSAGSAATSSYVNPLTQSVYVQGNLSASSGITGSFSGSGANLGLFSTTNGTRGVVPGSNGATSNYLKGDGTWSDPTPISYYLDARYSSTASISNTEATFSGWISNASSSMMVTGSNNELLRTTSTAAYLVTISGDLRVSSLTGSVYNTIFYVKDNSGNLLHSFNIGPELMNGLNARAYTVGDHYKIATTFITSVNSSKPLMISAKTNDAGTTLVPAWSSTGVSTETRVGNGLIVTLHKL